MAYWLAAAGLMLAMAQTVSSPLAAANRAKFEPVKTYSVADSATSAQPAISGNRIFVKDVSSLTLWTVR